MSLQRFLYSINIKYFDKTWYRQFPFTSDMACIHCAMCTMINTAYGACANNAQQESEVLKVKLLMVSGAQVLYSLHCTSSPALFNCSIITIGDVTDNQAPPELPCNLDLFHSLLLTVTRTCSS